MNEATHNDMLEALASSGIMGYDDPKQAFAAGWDEGYEQGVQEGKRQMWLQVSTVRQLEARTNREDGVSHSDPLD